MSARKNSLMERALKLQKRCPRSLSSPVALAAEYFEITDNELSNNGFAAQVEAKEYDEMVKFYDAEMSR